MSTPGTLSLEQEFQLKVLREQVENLAPDQAQEYLLEAMRQLMLKDNWIRHTFKECYLKL
ncbi:phycobilisome degradation protein nblA [Leptolyngbyaceae cyanobacterium CCMR0082]|uniref:Phycobilisome degradation protein nblA n=2 Tax=Adonisia turfae TaxID=2950184 RepID=A0A6M0SAI6_9CYAN|nr:NblA/ycf18 family protein [Adonisia turfae]MDV3349241.1 NblA/ycf18 family protein [Leptothoe sp. LEGE 181152]NEZ58647.1 phycobilisome degradation protein nblA [Adonisia turfae CCMR0081]NEZ65509.1 phycobilisome degradation protein nblA [Adonisia turfae CCMR0082]